MNTGISSLAKELAALRNLIESYGFDKFIFAPFKQTFQQLVDPLQQFVDLRWKEIREVLIGITNTLNKIDGEQATSAAKQLTNTIEQLNMNLDSHAKAMEKISFSIRSFAFSLQIASLLFFFGSFSWFFFNIWNYNKQKKENRGN